MKILILSDDFPPKSFGGAGIIAYWQSEELKRRGHTVEVITGEQKERAEEIIKDFAPDIIHAHNVHQSLSYKMLPIARKYSKKVVLTAHDAMMVHYGKIYPKRNGNAFDYKVSAWHQMRYFWRKWNPLRSLLIRNYLKNVDKILAVSDALAQALRQNGIENVETLHNGIDAGAFTATNEAINEFKNKHSLSGKKVMLFGGRIGRAKGGNVALNLLMDINKEMPDTRLLIAGREDAYTNELKQKAEKGGISDKLIFTGWLSRKDMAAAYHASDIVLTLSTYLDPFPTVNLEAMAAGKPVLGTLLGGTPEAVEDGVTGYIVDSKDREQVLEKAKKLLENPALAQKFGQAGHERVQKEFSLAKNVDELESLYASILSS